MYLLVIEQPLGTDKAQGYDYKERYSDKDESESVVTAKRPQ